MRNKIINFLIVLFITTASLFVLKKINLLDFNEIIKIVINNYLAIIACFILYFITLLLGTLRYKIILFGSNFNIKFKDCFKINSSSIFYGQWFPGNAAFIELFRIFFLQNFIFIKKKEAIYISLYDRFIGLISFFYFSLFSIFFLFDVNKSLFGIFFIIFSIILILLPKIFFKIFKIKHKSFSLLIVPYELLLSLFISFIIILNFYLLSISANLEIKFIEIAILMPLIAIINILPIGINLIGGNQIGFLFIFSLFLEKSNGIVSVSMIFAFITIITNLLIGLFYLKYSKNIFLSYYEKINKK